MKLSLSMNYLLTSCNNKQNIIMIVWIMSWSKTLEKAHSPPLTFFFVKFEEQVKCSCLVHTPPHLNHLPETFSHSLTLWYSFSLYLFIFHSYSYCSFVHHFCFNIIICIHPSWIWIWMVNKVKILTCFWALIQKILTVKSGWYVLLGW